MNCLEFRRRCLTEPNYEGRAFLLHESECGDCARFAVQTRALETYLVDAMRVNVPEGLAERVKLTHRVQNSGWKKRRVIALAASILVTLGLMGGFFFMTSMSTPLHAAVTKHIENEWESLVQKEDMDGQTIASTVSTIGGVIRDDQGSIKYASLCDFSEYGAVHLVITGSKGPVLALLLKEKYVSKTRFMTMTKPEGTKIEGMLAPTSNGSLAIVGLPEEDLQAVDKTVRDSIFWLL